MTGAQRAGQIIYDEHLRCRRAGLTDRFEILCRMEERRPDPKKSGILAAAWGQALEEYKRTLLPKIAPDKPLDGEAKA